MKKVSVSVFSAKTIQFQDDDRSTRSGMAVFLQQDEFRTNRFYFLAVTIPVFCRYAQNTVRPCSCGDQAVTHRHTHKKTTITLCLRSRVNKVQYKDVHKHGGGGGLGKFPLP